MLVAPMQVNAHDTFFKAMLSRPEHAASFLQQVLPARIVARIDFSSLALSPGSYIDEVLKARYSDILFSVKLAGRPALIYILFEHQSTTDGLMALRILRYEVRIWDRWLEDHPSAEKIPVILPVVLHHSPGGWQATTRFEELLDAAEALADVAELVPRFRFMLEDISHETDEALKSRAVTALVRLALWCLRHSREPRELVERLRSWAALVHEVRRAPGGMAAVVQIMRYIFEIIDPARPEDLATEMAAALEEHKEEIMTAADQLREQGREQGFARALEETRAMVLDQLGERFGAPPEDVVARVRAAGMTQLRAWAKRVVTAPTLADVLADA